MCVTCIIHVHVCVCVSEQLTMMRTKNYSPLLKVITIEYYRSYMEKTVQPVFRKGSWNTWFLPEQAQPKNGDQRRKKGCKCYTRLSTNSSIY